MTFTDKQTERAMEIAEIVHPFYVQQEWEWVDSDKDSTAVPEPFDIATMLLSMLESLREIDDAMMVSSGRLVLSRSMEDPADFEVMVSLGGINVN